MGDLETSNDGTEDGPLSPNSTLQVYWVFRFYLLNGFIHFVYKNSQFNGNIASNNRDQRQAFRLTKQEINTIVNNLFRTFFLKYYWMFCCKAFHFRSLRGAAHASTIPELLVTSRRLGHNDVMFMLCPLATLSCRNIFPHI